MTSLKIPRDPARVQYLASQFVDLICRVLYDFTITMGTFQTHRSTPVTIDTVTVCGYSCGGLVPPSLDLGFRIPYRVFGLDYVFIPNILSRLVFSISRYDVPLIVWPFSAHVVLQRCFLPCSCNSMTTSLISHMFSFSRAYAILYVILNLQSSVLSVIQI